MSERELHPWRTRARHPVLDARPWVQVWAETVELPEGRIVEGFYTIDLHEFVVILALTPDDEAVVERGYKHGAGRVCINLPAGYLEPGEDPLAAGRRELREETGYTAEEWRSLGSFVVDGNRGCGKAHFFLARGARQVCEPDSGDLEEMEIGLMALPDLVGAILGGEAPVLPMATAVALALMAPGRNGARAAD